MPVYSQGGLCPPKGDKPLKKINKTCKFWKEGNCSKGDKCRFQHKDVDKLSAPAPKSEAAPAAPNAGSPRANSPAPTRGRGSSPRVKSSDKAKPAACAISLEHAADLQISPKLAAAASHDEDFWEVDFGNRPIRHHKEYRVVWYVPDNSCPVNPKKLRSQAKLEQVLPVAPYVGS